jgi:hypothetical protein
MDLLSKRHSGLTRSSGRTRSFASWKTCNYVKFPKLSTRQKPQITDKFYASGSNLLIIDASAYWLTPLLTPFLSDG